MEKEEIGGVRTALFWSFIQQGSQQGLRFGLTIVMVRLLTPEDYGLLGMIIIFTALSKTLSDAGFSSALVQAKDISEADCNTAFYTNLGIALLLYGALFVGAPAIAEFYDQPVLKSLVRFTGLGIVVSALSAVQAALYTRKLDFRTPTRMSLAAMVCGGAAGIYAAFAGLGVWSLAIQALTTTTVKCVLFWYRGSFRPQFTYSRASFAKLFSFGSRVSVMSVLETVFTNLHQVVIGKLFAPALLGLYGRGKSLVDLGTMNVVQPVNLVIYPAMSRVQDDKGEIRSLHVRSLGLLGFAVTPTMVFLATAAEPIVDVLLTHKWIDCVPYLRLFCCVGALIPLRKACSTVLKATDQLNDALRLQLLSRSGSILAITATFSYGIEAMIVGEAINLAVFSGLYFRQVSIRTEATMVVQARAFLSSALPSALAGGVTLALHTLVAWPHQIVTCVALALTFGTTYLLLSHLVRSPAYEDARSVVFGLLRSRGNGVRQANGAA